MEVSVRAKGRGTISCAIDSEACVCFRPRCIVLCTNCGYRIKGRVRHTCPVHPQTVFLIDLAQCPRCKAYQSLLCEFGEYIKDASNSVDI